MSESANPLMKSLPRAISKERDSTGRTGVVEKIRTVTETIRLATEEIEASEVEIQDNQVKLATLRRLAHERIWEKVREKKTSVLDIVKKFFRGSNQRGVSVPVSSLAEIDQQIEELSAKNESLRQRQTELKHAIENLPTKRDIISTYFDHLEVPPLQPSEKEQLLTSSNLASLSLREYMAIWRRCNPYYVAHVTRQGFRDHAAMVYHSAGLDGKYASGMTGMLREQKVIRPPLGVHGLKEVSHQSVQEFLSPILSQSDYSYDEALEEAKKMLHGTLASAPGFPDKTAVHLTVEMVANGFYGGEDGNESFIVYPADFIASQHAFAFNGWEKDFTRPQSETMWNDLFVWPNSDEKRALAIDAGIVFLPNSTIVDGATGSKYDTSTAGVQLKPVIDDEKVQKFITWSTTALMNEPFTSLYQDLKNASSEVAKQYAVQDYMAVCSEQIRALGGFDDHHAAGLAEDILSELYRTNQSGITVEIATGLVNRNGRHWRLATSGIPARVFWEQYFAQNPQARPKHVLYYDGSPTQAVDSFLRQQGIQNTSNSASDPLLGFAKNHITDMENDERCWQDSEAIEQLCQVVISEHFNRQQPTAIQSE